MSLLASNIIAAVDSRIGAGRSGDKLLYSAINNVDGIYTRNAGLWAADVDLTCISVFCNYSGGSTTGTLIASRYALFATHYQPDVGNRVDFVTTGNVTVSGLVQSKRDVTDYYGLTVVKFTAALPSTITPAKCIPSDFWKKIPGRITRDILWTGAYLLLSGSELPMVFPVRHSGSLALCVGKGYWLALPSSFNADASVAFSSAIEPVNAVRDEYYQVPVIGDSGGPLFLLDSAGLVLVGLTYSTTGFIGLDVVGIEAAVTALG